MSRITPFETIIAQIDAAKAELDRYDPASFDWHRRCLETASILVPWLCDVAPQLKVFVEEVRNSPRLVRETWRRIADAAGKSIPIDLRDLMSRELDRESVQLANVGGDIVSKVVEKFLIDSFGGDLASNGRSDYPDLFLRSISYAELPQFKRLKDKSKQYGAALKGSAKRPVRVPDGLEIKTCKGEFSVDCHHAHAGLHLAVLFQEKAGRTVVNDVLAAFMRHADYRISEANTPTTTLKASFNGKNFVSLL